MLKFIKTNWVLVAALCLLVMMSLPLIYFGNVWKVMGNPNQLAPAPPEVQPTDIGVCFNSLMEARWMKEWAVMQETAAWRHLSISLKVAHHSLARQVSQINDLLARHVRVLILNPICLNGLEDVLEKAKSEGVKIIFYDEMTTGPCDLFLGIDYRQMGRIQAKALLAKTGPGNYLVFKGPENSYRAKMLYNGQQEILKLKSSAGVDILSVDTLKSWSADEAVTKIRATIVHQKLQAILIPEDLIADSVVTFYREQKSPIPFVTGAGAELTACQRIFRQEQLMTVAWDIPGLAKAAVISAQKLIRKKSLTGLTVMAGERRIPASIFPVFSVDFNNLQDVVGKKLKLYPTADWRE